MATGDNQKRKPRKGQVASTSIVGQGPTRKIGQAENDSLDSKVKSVARTETPEKLDKIAR
jgi:hypothetical protein